MINIDLFTNDLDIIKVISKKFNIINLFTEKNYLLKCKNQYKFNVISVTNKKKLSNKLRKNQKLGISYGFGIIFDKDNIKKYDHGIWNIHPGDLPSYRGRHPITAAFLNDEKKIGTSIHSINDKIDMGFLLAKTYVNRNYSDDENSIKKKIFKKLPKLLSLSLSNYRKKKLKKLYSGKYYKPFFKGVDIKDHRKLNFKYILNATKAQKAYGGICINGNKYIDAFLFSKKIKITKKLKIIFCKNNKKLIMKKK